MSEGGTTEAHTSESGEPASNPGGVSHEQGKFVDDKPDSLWKNLCFWLSSTWRDFWYYLFMMGKIRNTIHVNSDSSDLSDPNDNAPDWLKKIWDALCFIGEILNFLKHLKCVWLAVKINFYRKLYVDSIANPENYAQFQKAAQEFIYNQYIKDAAEKKYSSKEEQEACLKKYCRHSYEQFRRLDIVSHGFIIGNIILPDTVGTYPWDNAGFNSEADEKQLALLQEVCQNYLNKTENTERLYRRVESTVQELHPACSSNSKELHELYRRDLNDITLWLFTGAIAEIMEAEKEENNKKHEERQTHVDNRKEEKVDDPIKRYIETCMSDNPQLLSMLAQLLSMLESTSGSLADLSILKSNSEKAEGRNRDANGDLTCTGTDDSERRAE